MMMIVDKVRHLQLKPIQLVLIGIGGAILILALMVDWLGFGQPGNFGIGQLLLIVIGLVLVLIGLFGRRVIDLYRGIAIMLLNTLALLAFLELGAIVIARLGFLSSDAQVTLKTYPQLPYYTDQDWAQIFWRESKMAENYRYEPYTIWRHLPFEGTTVNISQESIRQTPGADCTADAYRVFTFGGSTMWGWGAPDWGTIAAHLQTGLEGRLRSPLCVINFGEDGFVSTQSLIDLMRQLQSGNAPDVVIFYDGVNDVYAAYESGQAGVHATLDNIAAKFEEQEHPLIKWIKSSRQFSLLESLVNNLKWGDSQSDQNFGNYKGLGIATDHLADSVTGTYLNNYKIVGALAQEYDFEYFFFWQPHLGIDQKELTVEEQVIKSEFDPELINLTQAVYDKIYLSAPDYEHLQYIADVFKEQDAQIWIDAWGHITPEGNRLVAQEMIAAIEKQLAEK